MPSDLFDNMWKVIFVFRNALLYHFDLRIFSHTFLKKINPIISLKKCQRHFKETESLLQ